MESFIPDIELNPNILLLDNVLNDILSKVSFYNLIKYIIQNSDICYYKEANNILFVDKGNKDDHLCLYDRLRNKRDFWSSYANKFLPQNIINELHSTNENVNWFDYVSRNQYKIYVQDTPEIRKSQFPNQFIPQINDLIYYINNLKLCNDNTLSFKLPRYMKCENNELIFIPRDDKLNVSICNVKEIFPYVIIKSQDGYDYDYHLVLTNSITTVVRGRLFYIISKSKIKEGVTTTYPTINEDGVMVYTVPEVQYEHDVKLIMENVIDVQKDGNNYYILDRSNRMFRLSSNMINNPLNLEYLFSIPEQLGIKSYIVVNFLDHYKEIKINGGSLFIFLTFSGKLYIQFYREQMDLAIYNNIISIPLISIFLEASKIQTEIKFVNKIELLKYGTHNDEHFNSRNELLKYDTYHDKHFIIKLWNKDNELFFLDITHSLYRRYKESILCNDRFPNEDQMTSILKDFFTLNTSITNKISSMIVGTKERKMLKQLTRLCFNEIEQFYIIRNKFFIALSNGILYVNEYDSNDNKIYDIDFELLLNESKIIHILEDRFLLHPDQDVTKTRIPSECKLSELEIITDYYNDEYIKFIVHKSINIPYHNYRHLKVDDMITYREVINMNNKKKILFHIRYSSERYVTYK